MRAIAWITVLSTGLLACSGIQVSSDYDPNADFSALRSYAWLDARSGVEGDREDVTSLLDRRIRSAIDEELASKGFALVDRSKAQVLVSYHLGVEKKLDVDTIYQSYGYRGGYYGGGGIAQTTVREYEEGTMLIDIIDAPAKQLVWRGSGQARLRRTSSPEQREERVREAVTEILEDFPPGAKH
jgi:hypothetical protein